MNPFENEGSIEPLTSNNFSSKYDITIWKESRGRKINTYVKGWNIDETDLKQHLKEFKVKNGCNGSIKSEDGNFVLHLQGNKIDSIIQFISDKGISSDEITIQG